MTSNPTPEQMALARDIVARRPGLNALQRCAILDGKWDDISGVQAAITETTELAARLVEKRSIGLQARAIDATRTATAIRSGDHLKGLNDDHS